MKTYVQPGDKITVPAPATAISGAGTVIGGSLFGIATHDAASGASCTYLVRNAIVTLPKLSTAVMAVGDRVHWDIDSSPPQLIGASAAAGDILNVGQVVEAAGNGATTVKVALTPDNASVYPDSTAALDTSVANLNAWATALATKLNADAGVTDTNYDTDPQT